jgi:hypothetical protein
MEAVRHEMKKAVTNYVQANGCYSGVTHFAIDCCRSATTDGGAALRLLSAFRLLRALRILRIAASKFPGLYVLIRTASLSAAPLANTMVMVVAFLAVLGIIGIQLFSGKMNYCSDPSIWTMTECVGLDADDVPREWRPYEVNFNNMAMALITEMLMASQDDWPVHMWAGCDITGTDSLSCILCCVSHTQCLSLHRTTLALNLTWFLFTTIECACVEQVPPQPTDRLLLIDVPLPQGKSPGPWKTYLCPLHRYTTCSWLSSRLQF